MHCGSPVLGSRRQPEVFTATSRQGYSSDVPVVVVLPSGIFDGGNMARSASTLSAVHPRTDTFCASTVSYTHLTLPTILRV